jgi:hypothetical protein
MRLAAGTVVVTVVDYSKDDFTTLCDNGPVTAAPPRWRGRGGIASDTISTAPSTRAATGMYCRPAFM